MGIDVIDYFKKLAEKPEFPIRILSTYTYKIVLILKKNIETKVGFLIPLYLYLQYQPMHLSAPVLLSNNQSQRTDANSLFKL